MEVTRNRSCFVLGPHRSGTTIVCTALAASGAFVCLTAADIVAFHEHGRVSESTGRERDLDPSALSALARRGETRRIDSVQVSEDLPEEYGFLVPGRRLTPGTAPVVASVYRELAGSGGPAWYLLRNPWDLARAPQILALFPEATFVFVVRDPVQTIDSQLQAVRTLYAEPSAYHALLDQRYRRMLARPMKFAFYRFLTGRPRMVDLLTRSFARTTARWMESLDGLPPERWIVTRYEDLVADPREELGRLFGFLGLSSEGIDVAAAAIRRGTRTLDPQVLRRVPMIRDRTRVFRQAYGYGDS